MSSTLPSCAIYNAPVVMASPSSSTSTAIALTSSALPSCTIFTAPVMMAPPALPTSTPLTSPIVIEEHTIIKKHMIVIIIFSSATLLFQFIKRLGMYIYFFILAILQLVFGKEPDTKEQPQLPPPTKVLRKNKITTDARVCVLEDAPSSEETTRESSGCGAGDVPESPVDMHMPLLHARLYSSQSECAPMRRSVAWWIELRTEFRVRTFAEVVSGVKATHVAVTAVNPVTKERIATARPRTYADATKGLPATLIIARSLPA
jgi:hypothetical protein